MRKPKPTLDQNINCIHALEGKKKKCMNILYTGSHIQPTLIELQKEMATANIVLDLPNSLLALPQGSK
jgi:hypothetical protein